MELLSDGPLVAAYSDKAARSGQRLPTPFDLEWKRLEDPYENMGQHFARTACGRLVVAGKLDEAETQLRDVLRQEWDPLSQEWLAEIEMRRQKPGAAYKYLQEVRDRAGPSAHLLARIGAAHKAAGRIDDAVAAWKQAEQLGITSELKYVHTELSNHFQKSGDVAASKRHASMASLADGQRFFGADDMAAARTPLEKAVASDPENAAAWFYLAEVHRIANRMSDAEKAYQRCLQIDSENGRAHRGLALLNAKP
jgi:Tfp pilus assembly protein PilF